MKLQPQTASALCLRNTVKLLIYLCCELSLSHHYTVSSSPSQSVPKCSFLDVVDTLRLLNSLALALQNKVAAWEWTSYWDLTLAQKVFRSFSTYLLSLSFMP